MSKSYIIRVNGKPIEVSSEVYDTYMKNERNFSEDLKREKIIVNQEEETVAFIPSREDSYDRLKNENNVQFADQSKSVEDKILDNIMIEKLLKSLAVLNYDERNLIDAIYYQGKSEREVSAETGIPQKTINYRKRKILDKLKKLLEN